MFNLFDGVVSGENIVIKPLSGGVYKVLIQATTPGTLTLGWSLDGTNFISMATSTALTSNGEHVFTTPYVNAEGLLIKVTTSSDAVALRAILI